MNRTFTNFIEPLESRRHLAAHPLPTTPRQEAQFELGLTAAYFAALSGAGSSADPLAPQPASPPSADALSGLSSTDPLDLLAGGSPVSIGPSSAGVGLAAIAPSLLADLP
jgi:hypothetical protein